ncbi:MAG: hypothetical protein Q8N98_02775, partial [bacterium]|nr:hypothetical protein [bacterium]
LRKLYKKAGKALPDLRKKALKLFYRFFREGNLHRVCRRLFLHYQNLRPRPEAGGATCATRT